MRIITGKFGGRKLTSCEHLKSLRPTTDKAREALFNILNSGKFLKEIDFSLQDIAMLDLCCGSGAVGIEALSRGVKSVTFIDNNFFHIEILKKNIELLKIEKDVKIIKADLNFLKQNDQNYDLIFLDPPYQANYHSMVENLLQKNWFQKNSLIVIEFGMELQNLDFAGLKLIEKRNYGNCNFGFFRNCYN